MPDNKKKKSVKYTYHTKKELDLLDYLLDKKTKEDLPNQISEEDINKIKETKLI